MSLTNIYNVYKSMQEDSIVFSFKGIVTSDFLASILTILETKMNALDEAPKRKKKVFNVLCECLQNLYHHIEDVSEANKEIDDSKRAIVMIIKENDIFQIRTGNFLERDKVNVLESKLSKINSLEKEELRAFYQEMLGNGEMSDKGTAGLGMIDIARKSGNKLEYDFVEVNETTAFFCLNVKID
jgi:hypothetical protein